MKPETLDALLIDHSLGELTPEVEELLQAFLDSDPAAAGRLAVLDTTVGTARKAVAPRLEPSAPTPFVRTGLGMRRKARLPFALPGFLRLAAGLAVGVVLGWLAGRGPGTPVRTFALARPAVVTPAGDSGSPAGFWSERRVLAEAHKISLPPRIHETPDGRPWILPGR